MDKSLRFFPRDPIFSGLRWTFAVQAPNLIGYVFVLVAQRSADIQSR
jgi:hypothetical protein